MNGFIKSYIKRNTMRLVESILNYVLSINKKKDIIKGKVVPLNHYKNSRQKNFWKKGI